MLCVGIIGFFVTSYPKLHTIYPKFLFALNNMLYLHQQANKTYPQTKKGWMRKWKTNYPNGFVINYASIKLLIKNIKMSMYMGLN